MMTRLAPSPTGALHLGNVRTLLVNWVLARQSSWRVVLRIEDLDGPRIKAGAADQLIDDLRWLGIDWDEGPTRQSSNAPAYRRAVEQLLSSGDAYPCICSRSEVATAASAPHADDGAVVYPGTCRGRFVDLASAALQSGRFPAVRFRCPDGPAGIVRWRDELKGPQVVDLQDLGDFVIAKADGTAAYQLAVVVDDAAAGVTHVVRGDDLLDSTPRQLAVYRALGLQHLAPLQYTHLPLVVGPDGRRLAKRHGDSRLSFYRSRGVHQRHVLVLLARWCGIKISIDERLTKAADLIGRLSLREIPTEPVTFHQSDHDWLLRGA